MREKKVVKSIVFRFPDGVSDETSSDYDINSVSEQVTYVDNNQGSYIYCAPQQGL